MKTSFGFAIVLSLLFLAPASGAPLDLASDPLWRALVLAPQEGTAPRPAAARDGESGIEAGCTASCGTGAMTSTVSCAGSGSCYASDGNCSTGTVGSVTCGSATTWCSCIDPPADPCDDYDTFSCDYSWNSVRNCCVASEFCPNNCLD